MQVHCDEGVASRIGPEPCAGIREDVGEASAGEHIGQPLSRDRNLSRVPTQSHWRKATPMSAQACRRRGKFEPPEVRRKSWTG